MNTKLRILPILILVAGLGAGSKAVGILSEIRPLLGVSEALAKGAKVAEEETHAAEDEDKKKADHAADEDEVGDEEGSDHASDGDGEAMDEDGEEHGAAAADEGEERQPPRPRDTGPQFSRAEVEMLQSLVERRETLELRGRELDIRENLLSAAEERIDDKIAQLKNIEATIEDLLKRHDDQEEQKLSSLVRIYENMKPKQAARIFEELDIDILIDVAERMNERKIAPILAQMTPETAMTLTVEIRTRKQLPETGGG